MLLESKVIAILSKAKNLLFTESHTLIVYRFFLLSVVRMTKVTKLFF